MLTIRTLGCGVAAALGGAPTSERVLHSRMARSHAAAGAHFFMHSFMSSIAFAPITQVFSSAFICAHIFRSISPRESGGLSDAIFSTTFSQSTGAARGCGGPCGRCHAPFLLTAREKREADQTCEDCVLSHCGLRG